MSAKQMWFGTRNYERWVPAPAPGNSFTREGWNSTTTYLNGGARVRNSLAGHKTYDLEWPIQTRDELRPILDFADGVYNTTNGTSLIYFIDPTAADKNIAPQHWGFPGLAAMDGRSLIRSFTPTMITTPANTLGYPARGAQYVLNGTQTAETLYLPIPPGYVAWVGAHGTASGGGGVRVTPYSGVSAGAFTTVALLSATSSTRVNASFSSASYTGIEVKLVNTGTISLYGIIIQILQIGATPETGGYISGQGNSGCEFEGKPVVTPYMVDKVGVTARLVETGAWL